MTALWNTLPSPPAPLRTAVTCAYLQDESKALSALLSELRLDGAQEARIRACAMELVSAVRERGRQSGGLEAFLHEYDLSSQEGVALMCLAEALLRIPDDITADLLIEDKLGQADWAAHVGQSHSLFVNASTWGLMLTGRIVHIERETREQPEAWFKRLVGRTGESVVRSALRQAMRIMGHQFVMGETIEAALNRSRNGIHARYRHSFDMLGEAALTRDDAQRYFHAYSAAIDAVANRHRGQDPLRAEASLSIKLSALHPRYHPWHGDQLQQELMPTLISLAQRARDAGVPLTWDAEESERLELSLDLFAAVARHPSLRQWDGLGLAVQAYQKRAPAVIAWLSELATETKRRIPVRLVKGAYWDSEIKRAQEQGLDDYPVYTRKAFTDVAYMACAARLLRATERFYPQFATHNAHTVAYILEMAPKERDAFEFQRLHGMGESLYGAMLDDSRYEVRCRVYAPVGGHRELLPYLVRRLLENGANTSFVNRLVDETVPVEEIVRDPREHTKAVKCKPHPRIPLPRDLHGEERRNAAGMNLYDAHALRGLATDLDAALAKTWSAGPIVGGHTVERGELHTLTRPADRRQRLGTVHLADAATVDAALAAAHAAHATWNAVPAAQRATLLERSADALEAHRSELIALIVAEAGRTVADAHSEVREAVDFCRYYAALARRQFGAPIRLAGYTGERNELWLQGRGVFACISPWNFPLAIFTGQIAAALAAGNTVIAKPALQTPLVAARAVSLLHAAGIPAEVLHLLPGHGDNVGSQLARDRRIAGIAFTGSTQTARRINSMLAERNGPIIPFIAETGGQNAMIADSSALADQVVTDAMHSAFNSAGQRCSALRVLLLQEEIAPRVTELLAGALAELKVGDPTLLHTDVGPLIDEGARRTLQMHIARLEVHGNLIGRAPLPQSAAHGTFLAPQAWGIDDIQFLDREVFGPILHVLTFRAGTLDEVLDTVHSTGFGLTMGLHTRIDGVIEAVRARARVGNLYVNRNMIGAVVGVQPFGGEGSSGTGPKAGGPHYLLRFATERVVTVNTAAAGGNTSLLALGE